MLISPDFRTPQAKQFTEPNQKVQRADNVEDIDFPLAVHSLSSPLKIAIENMDGSIAQSHAAETSIAGSHEPPKTSLLRRSPRFDDEDKDIIYEDLGIGKSIPTTHNRIVPSCCELLDQ